MLILGLKELIYLDAVKLGQHAGPSRSHSIGCENTRHGNMTITLSLKQWSCVLFRTNEIRGLKSCVLTDQICIA